MTDQQHSTTPPDSLVWEWMGSIDTALTPTHVAQAFAAKVARWSADQQLEACCDYLRQLRPQGNVLAEQLLAVCRPKPPSLKEQALKALDDISIASFEQDAANTIRYALEQLDD
jgi:hypothetical protein